VLRLRRKGVPRADGSQGDEYVTLKLALPVSAVYWLVRDQDRRERVLAE
jgi:hypothetical protein